MQVLIAVLALAVAASAPLEVAQSLSACRKVAEPAARLACFDDAAARFDAAQAQGAIVLTDRNQERDARRRSFGLNLRPVHAAPGAPGRVDDDLKVTATIARVRSTASGRWILLTEEGQQWRQSDERQLGPPRVGSKLEILGASRGFVCKVDGGLDFHCYRDR